MENLKEGTAERVTRNMCKLRAPRVSHDILRTGYISVVNRKEKILETEAIMRLKSSHLEESLYWLHLSLGIGTLNFHGTNVQYNLDISFRVILTILPASQGSNFV